MKKLGSTLFFSFLVSFAFSQSSPYDIPFLSKEGRYQVSKLGKVHTIEIDFTGLKATETYEVEVYFDGNLIGKVSSNGNPLLHTPTFKGNYRFRFYRIENGKRKKVKPEIGKFVKATKSRDGLIVTTSSTVKVTATVDAT